MSNAPQNRDTLFLKIAIQNSFLDPAQSERVLATIAERREIGVTKHAWDIAAELKLMSEANAQKIREAVERAVPPSRVGGFELQAPIGKGAVGTVYRAKQLSLDKIVAVKLLHPNHTAEERFVADFLREAKAVAKLNHPNIVHAIDAGSEDGRYYFAMEFVDGETLRQKLERRGKLSLGETMSIAEQVASGLSHAHQNGLLHRDIKPDNILIGNDGRTRIADLGLAVPVDDAELLAAEHKKQGTPFYLSPEAAQSGDLDARSDLYSLGALLYQCLAGKPVFTGGSVKEILTKHVHQDPTPIAEAAGSASPIDAVIMKLLSKDPAARYSSAEAVLSALATAAKEAAAATRSAPRAAPKSRKRSPAGAGGPENAGENRVPTPRAKKVEILTSAHPSSRRAAFQKKNRTGSLVGVGVGVLLAVIVTLATISKSSGNEGAPTVDEKFEAELKRLAEKKIELRIAEWKKYHEKEERLASEAAERAFTNPRTDELRRRALQNALKQYPDRMAASLIIAQIEKVENMTRESRISGPSDLLAQAKEIVADGRIWTGYLLLDDRKREARKDQEMNQVIEQYLSDLDEVIDNKVAEDLEEAKKRLARKDFNGALELANGVSSYADPTSVAKAEELATEIETEQREYTQAETARRLTEEKRRYATVLTRFREAALSRDFKDAISAAIELQAEMSTEEIRNRLETDLSGFALLDQFNRDALTQLDSTKSEDRLVKLEMKPIGNSARGRRYNCKVDRVAGNEVFINVDGAIFPLAVEKITDQTIFDLVQALHGEGSPSYLIPLGILFLYRGNHDIAKSHFDLASGAGTSPDTWLDHLEYLKKIDN